MLLWEIAQQVFQSVVVSTLHLEKSGGLQPQQPPGSAVPAKDEVERTGP